VVDGPSAAVYRIRLGDPHPFAWIRVLFNVALCHRWFGDGPWDDIGRTWMHRHPPEAAGGEMVRVARISLDALDEIVDVCTRQPMRAFHGAPLAGVLDPRRVHPAALAALEQQAGGSLLTSSYLRRRDALRILAVMATRAVTDATNAATHRAQLRSWVVDLGADAGPRPVAVRQVA
jgi:hypothetical protein